MNISKYCEFFETINETTPLSDYEVFFDENSKFKDPFHEVVGAEKIYLVFQKMYKNLDKPHFKVIEISESESYCYIRWIFNFYFKNSSKLESFEGVSRVVFIGNKVESHIDYWDAAENLYEKLPLISSIIKFIKKKITS